MFTGLIEEKGIVQKIVKSGPSASLTIKARKVLNELEIGESIAVNGVCLTVTAFISSVFTVDVMLDTLIKTNLGYLTPGAEVNLERALGLGSRLGGHLVTGHVDGTGVILSLDERGIATKMRVKVPPELEKYLVLQGSVALDGVSLTVAELKPGVVMVSLIPHTKKITTLGSKKVGDLLNIETDILGKYVDRLLVKQDAERAGKTGISIAFLAEHGFM